MKEFSAASQTPTHRITLAYYYWIGIISVTIGVAVVVLLNLFTPLQIIENSILEHTQTASNNTLFEFALPRLFLLLFLSYGVVLLGLRSLLKPIAVCLAIDQRGEKANDNQIREARKRLLNLHNLFAWMNILLWVSLPALVGAAAVMTGVLDYKTAIILSARASIVGFISSSIATLKIKITSRKVLIPYFFPEGLLGQIEGTRQRSIGQQIMFVNRLGALIPLVVLLITLLTIQWELENVSVPAVVFGRELIIFTLILIGWVFLFSTLLSQLQSRIIVEPINALVSRLRDVKEGEYNGKIQVTSNDEIGYAGAVVNTMTQGLQERLAMQRSLGLARQIQQNLLPKSNPIFPGLDIAGRSIYCDETGGDYYDFIEFDDKYKMGFVIGDVSGHGISSALLMATIRGFLRQRTALPGSISAIVSDVNVQLTRDVEDSGNFFTMFYLTIDTKNRSLEWIRAGHDPALFYDSRTSSISELKGPGIAMGIDLDHHFERNEKLDLQNGQIILLGTDGIWEARNSDGKMFGKNTVKQILMENAHRNANEILEKITSSLTKFQENISSEDDVTCIIIKVNSLF
ncbi:MAG: serine phosphatase RsbU (regulator of sigma subunit) [Desulforhopalus sp.]|jgi:serine phosphatase RsbU (regulator of sigma subunit)